MAVSACSRLLLMQKQLHKTAFTVPCRLSNTLFNTTVEQHRRSELAHDQEKDEEDKEEPMTAPRDYKFIFPEFLPIPDPRLRDRIAEKLERQDMFRRRAVCQIPEFYVGTIMAVIASDRYCPGKKNRFVGICIQRGGNGLRAHFTLRNVVDGQGVEICYDLYSPVIQEIEVLRLEKRLDEELFYLRDALPEYSTIPFDIEVISHPPGAPVPINQTKVKLGPKPWHERWERQELKGIQDPKLPERFYKRAEEVAKPWEKIDIMKQYRESINDVDTEEIMKDVARGMKRIEMKKRKQKLEEMK